MLPCRTAAAAGGNASSARGAGGAGAGGARADVGRVGRFVRKGERIELEHTEYSGARRGAKTSLMMRPRQYGGAWEVSEEKRRARIGVGVEVATVTPQQSGAVQRRRRSFVLFFMTLCGLNS